MRELPAKNIYGISGPNGLSVIASRYSSQDAIPSPVDANQVRFTVPISPRTPGSVLHLQAIGKSGRIYRSKPVALQSPSAAKIQIAVYSETAKQPVKLSVAPSRVPDIRY